MKLHHEIIFLFPLIIRSNEPVTIDNSGILENTSPSTNDQFMKEYSMGDDNSEKSVLGISGTLLKQYNTVQDECIYCMESLEHTNRKLILLFHDKNNIHCFHFSCFFNSVKRSKNSQCPLCRRNFKIDDLLLEETAIDDILSIDLTNNISEESRASLLDLVSGIRAESIEKTVSFFFSERVSQELLNKIVDVFEENKSGGYSDLYEELKFIRYYKEKLDCEELNLAERITDKNSLLIAAILSHLTHLTRLEMQSNNLGCEAIEKMLVTPLRNLKKLKYLDLSGNNLGCKAAESLAVVLREFEFLEYLDIAYNAITARGAVAISQGLKQSKNLKSVDFSGNDIGEAGMTKVIQNLIGIEDSKVELAKFSDNSVGEEKLTELQRLAKFKIQAE